MCVSGAGAPHIFQLFLFFVLLLLLLLLPYHVCITPCLKLSSCTMWQATVQPQSHSKFVWTTCMRVLALHIHACVMGVCAVML